MSVCLDSSSRSCLGKVALTKYQIKQGTRTRCIRYSYYYSYSLERSRGKKRDKDRKSQKSTLPREGDQALTKRGLSHITKAGATFQVEKASDGADPTTKAGLIECLQSCVLSPPAPGPARYRVHCESTARPD